MVGPIKQAKKKAKGPRISVWNMTCVFPATWDIECVITVLAKRSFAFCTNILKGSTYVNKVLRRGLPIGLRQPFVPVRKGPSSRLNSVP